MRQKIQALGFPADLMDDEVLAGSLVLVRRDGWWEVVEGFRVVSMIESTEWMETTTSFDSRRSRVVGRPYVNVLLIGNRPRFQAWASDPSHVFAFDEWRFYLGHLECVDFQAGTGNSGPWVELEMRSVGHYMLDVWGVRPR